MCILSHTKTYTDDLLLLIHFLFYNLSTLHQQSNGSSSVWLSIPFVIAIVAGSMLASPRAQINIVINQISR